MSQQAKLEPSDGFAYDRFGWSVGMFGATVIAGALRDDGNGYESGYQRMCSTRLVLTWGESAL